MNTKLTTIFLGNQGLSSSEATHTANVAKELAARISFQLNSITVIEEKITVDGIEHEFNNINKLTETEILDLIAQEGNLYSLCAWLKEGIKSKEDMINFLSSHNFADELPFIVTNPLITEKVKERHLLVAPIAPLVKPSIEELKPEDVLDIKELNEYFTLEAKAAHIGKKIHNSGLVAKWTADLNNLKPIRFEGEKQNMIKSTPVLQKTFVDKLFFDLQKEHRENESRLNYFKANIKNEAAKRNGEIQRENVENNASYQVELKNYQDAYNSLTKEMQDLMVLDNENQRKRTFEVEKLRTEKKNEVSGLKIIIPNELEEILTHVQTFSKKS